MPEKKERRGIRVYILHGRNNLESFFCSTFGCKIMNMLFTTIYNCVLQEFEVEKYDSIT